MAIHDEKYVSITTYRKDGTPKQAPVWIADLGDGTMGFTTQSKSWKVKRMNNNANIALQPCDQRGNITAGSTSVEGTAVVHVGGAEFERVKAKIVDKYGFMVTVINTMNRIAGLFGKPGISDTAIIITLK